MNKNRKRIVSVSLVLMLVLLGLATLVPASSAAKVQPWPTAPCGIESVTWDKTNQGFVVEISLKFGLATAGEYADFSIVTTLNFDADGNSVTLSAESNIVKAEDAIKDFDNMIIIDPTFIPWYRNGGEFEGPVEVKAEAHIQNNDVLGIISIRGILATVVVFESPPPRGLIEGTVTNSDTGDPLDLVDVSVSRDGIFVDSVQTNVAGFYSFVLLEGTYSFKFEKEGFSSENVAGVFVSRSGVTTVDAELDPLDDPIPPPIPTD
jgi:hypothetical protein